MFSSFSPTSAAPPRPPAPMTATLSRLFGDGVPPLGGFVLLATLTRLGPWLREHGVMGMVIYFAVTGLLMGISFVPTYSCAILAGWAFGFAVGWPLAMVTITVAAVIAYAIGRV